MDMMKLEAFSEKELIQLNHKIVERIKFLRQMRVQKKMLDFYPGQSVSFETTEGLVSGIVARFNKKTVTVVTHDGERWKVSPSFLSKSKMKDVTPENPEIRVLGQLD